MVIRLQPALPAKKPSIDPQLAAKHLDIVLGLDFHILKVPWPFTPCPITPFAAIVFDPLDYLHFTIPAMPVYSSANGGFSLVRNVPMGGTVLINGFYRAAAVSGLMSLPPIPIPRNVMGPTGAMVKKFTPLHAVIFKPLFMVPFLAPHDGQISHGSQTVFTQHMEQSTFLCNAFSCADVGRVVPTYPMAFFNNYATKIIAVLPMGNPVMIGGTKVEHTYTTDELINSLMFLGLMKVGGALLRRILGRVLTRINSFLCNRYPRFRPVGQAMQRAICRYLGEPVDAATGHMSSKLHGFSLPGPIPFTWEADYYSDSTYEGPMGKSIYHSYDIALVIDEKEGFVVMNDTAGRAVAFPTLKPGESFYNSAEKFELHCSEEYEYYVSSKDGLYYYFNRKADRFGYRKVRTIANRNGFAIKFNYNFLGYLTQITDSAGRNIEVINDEEGRILELRLAHPEQQEILFAAIRYEYNDKGQMTAMYDAQGYANRFVWQDRFITERTFKDGTAFTFHYNKSGKCIAALGPNDLFSYRFEYLENKTIVTNSLGKSSTYYHRNSVVTRIVDSLGGEHLFTYDADYNLIAEQNPVGIVTSYHYDKKGNLISSDLPGQGTVSITYNNFNKPEQRTEPNGGVWIYAYDEQGNLIKRVDPLNNITLYQYTDGLLTAITNATGNTTYLSYDKNYNLSSVLLANDTTIQYRFDGLGRCIEIKDPNGSIQYCKYDLDGNVIRIDEPDGNIRKFSYDSMGNIIRATDANNDISLSYNFFRDIIRRVQGGSSTQFHYDTEGQLRTIINEHNDTYSFELDDEGNMITEVGFDGLTRCYIRNLAGEVVETRGPGNKITSYEYNSAGQVKLVQYSDGSTNHFEYDTLGDLIEAKNNQTIVTFQRDLLGRIISEQQGSQVVKSQFNQSSNRISINSSLGADIRINYNSETGLAENIVANGWEATMRYNKAGQLISRNFIGGIEQLFEYDKVGKLTKQSIRQNNAFHHQRQYIWDVDYRLKEIHDTHQGNKVFQHDLLGNLAEVIYSDGTKEYRMPDAVGNLFETKERKDRRYGKGGRLLESRNAKYKYDDEGNLIEKQEKTGKSWRYVWSQAGMLEKVIRPDGYEVSFAYDALGRRIWKKFKNTYTKWVWDGNVPLHEWKEHAETGQMLSNTNVDDDGVITWVFEEESFVPVGKIKGVNKYTIITDHLGTPHIVYKENGAKVWESEMNSYGKVRMFEGELSSCPFRYQGQYEDVETGLNYNRFRYYNANEGVYVSQDPIKLSSGVFNFYSYVKDTNIWVDILGLQPGAGGVTTPVGDLRNAGLRDAHHVIQDAAVRDLPGYDTNRAPGVQLQGPSTQSGTPHYNATQTQRRVPGGGTYGAERRIAYRALRSAGYTPQQARQAILEADDYFRSIGVTNDTPTRRPGNRRICT